MTFVAAHVAALTFSLAGLAPHPHHHHHYTPHTVKGYARHLVLRRWHSVYEFRALDQIVRPESAWNPCASYPSQHDCHRWTYSACGVPQANPCPYAWRGRLWDTRYAQVRWLIRYVARRYGSPSRALAYHNAYGTY